MAEATTSNNITSTKELKRVLGRKDLLSIAIGQTIGSGVFALIGSGIGMTGRSVFISMLLAALFTILMDIPLIFVSGTVRLRGGFYTQLAFLFGKKAAGFYVIVHYISWIALSMYAISFAQYALALFGTTPDASATMVIVSKVIAVVVLTVFYICNIFGIQNAARIQNLMMLCMTVGLTAFIVFGLPQISPDFFTEDFMTSGVSGMFATGALFTWAIGGSNVIIHLGAEAKNPTKDIPLIVILATIIIAIFYALICVVAAGVLPVAEVAGQPLTVVAARIFPRAVYVFFVVGGAMFALTTTLNSCLGWVTKPILQAAVDGWFPKPVATIHPKYKTPVVILTILYIGSMIPIVFGVNLGAIANMAVILTNICFAMTGFSAMNIRKKLPDVWAKSRFHTSDGVLIFFSVLGGLTSLLQVGLLVMVGDMNTQLVVGNAVLLVIALGYAFWRDSTGKVNMEISYEES